MSKASTNRHSINVTEEWIEAYALKNRAPRVVEVPARYWLAALPAIVMCIGLLLVCPNPVKI